MAFPIKGKPAAKGGKPVAKHKAPAARRTPPMRPTMRPPMGVPPPGMGAPPMGGMGGGPPLPPQQPAILPRFAPPRGRRGF